MPSSWNYSGDPSTSELDAVRFWLQDTDSTRPLLTDLEVNYVISVSDPLYGSPVAAAALCADVVVGKFGQEVSISGDGVSISADQLIEHYKELAQNLRETYRRIAGAGAQPIAFGTDLFDFPDFSEKPFPFFLGMSDNPYAGPQDVSEGWGYAEVPDSGFWTGP